MLLWTCKVTKLILKRRLLNQIQRNTLKQKVNGKGMDPVKKVVKTQQRTKKRKTARNKRLNKVMIQMT